jgi:hypothetical protein
MSEAGGIGITKKGIIEVIIHRAHYAGWPTLSITPDQFNRVLADDAQKKKAVRVSLSRTRALTLRPHAASPHAAA